jgi:predicted DNA-binding antitoxin AbrB/MazE fold protein
MVPRIITAVVEGGQLRPTEPLDLAEGTEVKVMILSATTTPIRQTSWPCQAGSAKDTVHWMADDFDAPLDDFAYTG